jgi:2-oxo-4-hydroxy-4-carboxy-5-ureidoimidazoline decarboxylase
VADRALAEFNALPADVAERELRACNAAPRFAREIAAGRPYPSAADLARAAQQVAAGLSWDEVGTALAAHPRIGQRAAGDSAEATSSRREQAGVDAAPDEVRTALAAGNRAYEERFGHVYLVRAAGRTGQEMLALLHERLGNDEASEQEVVRRQLAEITSLRLRRLWCEGEA